MRKVCLIGAGVSGIAAALALRERSIEVQGYEKGSLAGGLWRYGNDNGLSGIYDSLHLNTSKSLTGFPEFPMPEDYPDYPDHRQFVRYLDEAIRHYRLEDVWRFRTEVTDVSPEGDAWRVRLSDGSDSLFSSVLVASGHHWKPRRPTFPGSFGGTVLHSHEYRTPEPFRGKRVLVVGIGNSGVDIACDAAPVAGAALLSTRRGAHVLPKHLLGRPIDRWGAGLVSHLPPRVQGWMISAALRLVRGSLASYGLPEPEHRIDQAHPTVSSRLLELLKEGRIRVVPDVRELRGDRVLFADHREEPVDVLVLATGYDVAFPFFRGFPVDLAALYRQVVWPERKGLYFIGLVQPFQGPVLRSALVQSRWVARLIDGTSVLAGPAERSRMLEEDRRWREKALVRTPRHALEVNYYAYVRAVEQEMKRTPEGRGG
jgi:cation diffusion facilitator CzcD-associated flavoprotein CzcO